MSIPNSAIQSYHFKTVNGDNILVERFGMSGGYCKSDSRYDKWIATKNIVSGFGQIMHKVEGWIPKHAQHRLDMACWFNTAEQAVRMIKEFDRLEGL